MKNKVINCNKKTIGLVYDVVKNLKTPCQFDLPDDAYSEWESQETIELIAHTWLSLSYNLILFPIDHNFLQHWAKNSHKCDVIHSLVEGFGSLARESWIASLCELSGLPCIGSNPFVHAFCMSKHHVKLVCQSLNIPVVQSFFIQNLDSFQKIPESFFQTVHFIKPNGEGSGMGVDVGHSISKDKQKTYETVKTYLTFIPMEYY